MLSQNLVCIIMAVYNFKNISWLYLPYCAQLYARVNLILQDPVKKYLISNNSVNKSYKLYKYSQ